jgi:hypothetical protein
MPAGVTRHSPAYDKPAFAVLWHLYRGGRGLRGLARSTKGGSGILFRYISTVRNFTLAERSWIAG